MTQGNNAGFQAQPHRESASDALRNFYNRSHRLIDGMMTAQGASYARTRLLMYIAKVGSPRSIDLADFFGYAPRSVTEAIDGLERDGLVRRDPDPADRRAKRLSLTPAGVLAAASGETTRQHFIEDVFGALDPAECAALVALVEKLNRRLDTL